MELEYIIKLIANNGFPIVLSLYLVIRIDYFTNELIKNQKEFSRNITREIRDINKTISELKTSFAKIL